MVNPYLGRGEIAYDPADPNTPKGMRDTCAQLPSPKKRNPRSARMVRRIAELKALIAPLAEELAACRKEHEAVCQHPAPHLRYVRTYSEDEYGSTLKSQDYIWCVDCGKKVAEVES